MPPTIPPPKSGNPAPAATRTPVQSETFDTLFGPLPKRDRKPRMAINAVEGWGKTTMGAYSPKPLILMAEGEEGFETLRDNNLAPDVHAVRVTSWEMLIAVLTKLERMETIPYETLVLDAVSGFENLAQDYVCRQEFGGRKDQKGWFNFQKGPVATGNEWESTLLRKLSSLNERGVGILLLGHYAIANMPNPDGKDYPGYVPDATKYVWGPTAKWLDAIFFGTFLQAMEKDGSKVKYTGDATRILACEHRPYLNAKNRFGLPEEIYMPKDHRQMWSTLATEIEKAIATNQA